MGKGKISFDGKQFALDMKENKSKFLKKKEFPGLVDHVNDIPQECEYEATSSKITSITLGGRLYDNETIRRDSKIPDSQPRSSLASTANSPFAALKERPFHPGKEIRENRAGAPYNFVPLNTEVVQFEKPPAFDRFHHETRLSGFITLDIKTLTPLYIRGRSKDESDFFSPRQRQSSHSGQFAPGNGAHHFRNSHPWYIPSNRLGPACILPFCSRRRREEQGVSENHVKSPGRLPEI